MKIASSIALIISLVLAIAHAGLARTLIVPTDYASLAAANRSARDNDTVLVLRGVYMGESNTSIRVQHKVVWISDEGPDSTIIDGDFADDSQAFVLADGRANGSEIHGFTITGMTAYAVLDSSTSDTRISNCLFIWNINRVRQHGSGLKLSNADRASVDHCIFRNNDSGVSGGGMIISYGHVNVRDCIFENNGTQRSGGAIVIVSASFVDVVNCVFKNNYALFNGGGISVSQNSEATISNCTFVLNVADESGGGLYKGASSNPTVVNSIFWGNSAPVGRQLHQANDGAGAGGQIDISYCTVDTSGNDPHANDGWRGEHINNDSPEFVDGPDPIWGVDSLYLGEASPCIDAGSVQAAAVGMDTLFTTNNFEQDRGVVDLGFHYDRDSYRRVGNLYGTVTLAKTGAPLVGVTVGIRRRTETVTDEDGIWEIRDFHAGPVAITFSKNGCIDTTVYDTLRESDDLRIDVALLNAEFNLSIQAVDVRSYPDSTEVVEFSASNRGSAPLDYTASARLLGDIGFPAWTMRQSLNATQIVDDDRLNGFAYVNGSFYIAGSNGEDSSQIYVLDQQGQFIRSFDQLIHTRYGMKGLTFDGVNLWGGGDENVVQFTTAGEYVSEFEVPINGAQYLAWDSDRELIWMTGITTDIYARNRNGEVVDTLPGFRSLRKYGLEYWPDDPDHHNLYILSRTIGGENNLTKVNVDSGDSLFVNTLRRAGEYLQYDIKIENLDLLSTVLISMENAPDTAGGDKLNIWQLSSNMSFLSILPSFGSIPQDSTQEFSLGMNFHEFPLGRLEAELDFEHTSLNHSTQIPISIEILDPDNVQENELYVPVDLKFESINPNPFNGQVKLSYSIPRDGRVSLVIYDLEGREVESLIDGYQRHGEHSLIWDAVNQPSGIYFARIRTNGLSRIAKMSLCK